MASDTASTPIVLIVDDEPDVLAITKRMVERLGYTALAFNHPTAALQLVQHTREPISCALLDLTMPTMNGVELFQAMRVSMPTLRAILCSGYSEPYATEQYLEIGLAGFLSKPFRLEDLRQALQLGIAS
jgi:two-component system, cell cycle sensor histidine kinase and response regulator CckA